MTPFQTYPLHSTILQRSFGDPSTTPTYNNNTPQTEKSATHQYWVMKLPRKFSAHIYAVSL